MPGPGYQDGAEPMWWWKVAVHLDQAQLALANAMAHNVDDPRYAHALYERLREGQAILLEIFRAKGLLPGAPNGRIEAPPDMPPPPSGPYAPQPMAVVLPFPSPGDAAAVPVAVPVTEPPIAAEDPAVLEADQASATSEPEISSVPSAEVVDPAAIASDAQVEAPPADPGASG